MFYNMSWFQNFKVDSKSDALVLAIGYSQNVLSRSFPILSINISIDGCIEAMPTIEVTTVPEERPETPIDYPLPACTDSMENKFTLLLNDKVFYHLSISQNDTWN